MQGRIFDEPALAARAEENHRELFRAMARVSPHGAIEEDGDLLMVVTGPLLPMLNFAALKRVPADAASTLARAQAFFGRHGTRFMLNSTGEAAAAIAGAAQAARMEPDNEPGMLLAPLTGEPAMLPGLTIEIVRDSAELQISIDTMTAGFGEGAWALPEILAGGALLQVPDITYYTGFMDGRPVATATRFTSHRIAGVNNVSTIPAYRRRGIGAAMTSRVALDGGAEGCVASFLTASEMGQPVYRRLGYREVISYRRWLSPPV